MKEEEWKSIKEFEGLYEISSLGRVRSLDKVIPYKKSLPGTTSFRKGKILKPNINRGGYHLYTLTSNKKPYYRYSHRLVVQYFISDIPSTMEVNHKDGIKSNNSVENLEICTSAENNKHAGLLNLKPIGTNHTNSRFTHEDLKQIRSILSKNKYTHRSIARMFKVHRSTISRIARNETYKKEPT